MKPLNNSRGIIIIGGGLSYFTNAFINIKLLRFLDCKLPIELWILPTEADSARCRMLGELGATFKIAEFERKTFKRSHEGYLHCILKLWALVHTEFREVICIDSDCFPVMNPVSLFECPGYKERGAVFWPSITITSKDNPVWKELGLPYREEPELELGQMLIDIARHREPLALALQWEMEAEKSFWGDKDKIQFAFHKFGRTFAMIPHAPQILAVPGREDLSVICQHDFAGRRLFQHRKLAKWDLLAHNPRIPGYLLEDASREYLLELRAQWNGRINWHPPLRIDYTPGVWRERLALVKDLLSGIWLVEDRRHKPRGCCGPPEKWTNARVSKPWNKEFPPGGRGFLKAGNKKSGDPVQAFPAFQGKSSLETPPDSKENTPEVGKNATWDVGLRCTELAFLSDYTLSTGLSHTAYWWDLNHNGLKWQLNLSNAECVVAHLGQDDNGDWFGNWTKGARLALRRVDRVYGSLGAKPETAPPAPRTQSASRGVRPRLIHIANHAFGIGDAITGLYTAVGAAKSGYKVVYHTRYPEWLERASYPNLSITDDPPPKGTLDMDTDYEEQLRYGSDKVRWYAGRVAGKLPVWNGYRPLINRSLHSRSVDFQRYAVISPFAAAESRNWPEIHWRRLAHLLRESGLELVVIGIEIEEKRIAKTFDKTYAYWAIKQDDTWVKWVTDLMLGAEIVVGLDSGMIHMAGLLGVPAVCIHSHLPPEFLFSCAPSIKSVIPQTKCVFCRWQEDRGCNDGCATACSALLTVGPEAVMAALKEITAAADGGRVDHSLRQNPESAPTVARGAAERGVTATRGGKGRQ